MWAREWRKKEVGVSIRVAMRDAGPSVEPFCQGKKRDHLTIGYIVVEENRRGKREREKERERERFLSRHCCSRPSSRSSSFPTSILDRTMF